LAEGLAKISSFSASGGQRASPFGNPSWVRHVTPQAVYGAKAFLIFAKGSALFALFVEPPRKDASIRHPGENRGPSYWKEDGFGVRWKDEKRQSLALPRITAGYHQIDK
jgi:hypothetical protein